MSITYQRDSAAADTSPRRPIHWSLLSIFFSFLPICAAIFGVCFGVGILLIARLLAENHYVLAGISFLVFTVVLGSVLAPLAYRFLARALPLKASGDENRGALRLLYVALTVLMGLCLAVVAVCWDLIDSMLWPSGGNFITQAIESAMSYIALTLFAIMLLFCLCVTYGVIKMIALHRRPAAWSVQPFVLFLRSFGSISDSAAIGPMARASGLGMRVALLSSPRQLKSSWNPLILAVAGFNFRHPFRTVPVFLESTDATWAADVRRLAALAHLVVIDVSHRTPGLAHEIDILEESGLEGKTVRLVELSGEENTVALSQDPGEDVVFMERSQSLRRLSQFMGFTFTYLGFVIMSAFVVSIFDFRWSTMLGNGILWSSLLYSVAPAVWGAAELSPAAGFTRDSARNLVEAMKRKAGHIADIA